MFGKLLILFILVPLIELALFMTLGEKLGLLTTVAIIIITGFIGAALAKSEGRKALSNFRKALSEGRVPHQEATDGILILLAGAVLLTPGFLTDAVGFLLLIPPVRALIRVQLAQRLKDKIHVSVPNMPDGMGVPEAFQQSNSKPSRKSSSLDNGEVIDV